jgi:hypothetical protein
MVMRMLMTEGENEEGAGGRGGKEEVKEKRIS